MYYVYTCMLQCASIFHCTFIARVGVSEGGNVGVSVGGANVSGSDGGGSYDLDDFEDEAMMQEKQDYAYLIRSKLASEHKQKSSVSGFEVHVIPLVIL